MRSLCLVSVTACVVLGGCSTVPLAENVTGEATHQIARKIQCEARQALDNITVALLRDNDATADLADRIERGTFRAVELTLPKNAHYLARFTEKQLKIFNAYTLSAVTFDFTFDVGEINDNTARANFRLPLADGLFQLGANAGAKFERGTERKFQITNTFYDLHGLDRDACARIAATSGHLIYPITGKIGLEELFVDFVEVDHLRTVAGKDPYTHRIKFRTTVTAGATPTITLDPIPDRRFRLGEASATVTATRADFHEVTVSLNRGDPVTSRKGSIQIARLNARSN